MNYTEEQRKAIEKEGRVIVSASAGSGKTKVMIERIFSTIREGKAHLKEVLAVTFTNKAATQMREKLRGALTDAYLSAYGEERQRIREELDALPLADISTVHSFCSRLIRTYFYLLPEEDGVSSDFRILSKIEAAGLSSRAVEAVFERAYRDMDEGFRELLKVYYRRGDEDLKGVVIKAYQSVREFENWQELLEAGRTPRFEEIVRLLDCDFCDRMARLRDKTNALKGEFTESGFLNKCDDLIDAEESFLRAQTLFGRREVTHEFMKMPALKDKSAEAKDRRRRLNDVNLQVKELYDVIKRFSTEEEESALYREAFPRAAAIANLAIEYGREYARLKAEAGALDYNDLQHIALKILSIPELQGELRARYRYIFVDEYQDVNPLQEEIISRIAGENVFLVGDAKQAIYGFRGSKTEYFHQKERSFGGALPLFENFRSASCILDAVNEAFGRLVDGYIPMRGGRLYKNDALKGAGVFCHKTEKNEKPQAARGIYSVLNPPERIEDKYARDVVRIVLNEYGSNFFDSDGQCVRPLEYRDIAVLTRKNSGMADRIVHALTECGVPVTSASKVNVCALYEGRLIVNWLKYLDNFEDDVPLAGAMLSSIGGFCEDDLSKIRLAFPDGCFREAVKRYLPIQDDLGKRLQAFFETSRALRAAASVRSCAEIIELLLLEGLEAEIAVKGDGKNRLGRVRRLIAEAENAESLNDFLQKLKQSGEKIECTPCGGDDAVRVTTMHNAKGLEYPVVILTDLDTRFHRADSDELLFSECALFAPFSIDFSTHSKRETIARKTAKLFEERSRYEGELNLLYVAMTRAQYRLHLMLDERKRYHKFGDTIYLADFLDADFREKYPLHAREELKEPLERKATVYPVEQTAYDAEKIRLAFEISQKYPYRADIALPQKSSATELIKAQAAEKSYAHGGATREEGTAYHKFLQYVTFGEPIAREIERMIGQGVFSSEEAALIQRERLQNIMLMPAIQRLKGKRVEREQTFLLSLPANEVFATDDGQTQVLFQGAIDLLLLDEDGYTVYDYKYSGLDARQLAEKYRPQISLYKKAVARAKGVDERKVRALLINIFEYLEIEM